MMEIDIISFTDEQFAALTEEQLLEVENVQMKKNRLTEDLEEEKPSKTEKKEKKEKENTKKKQRKRI